jgi:hypothetical protein
LDSIILIFQLGVLKYELNKEQPYTNYHLIYFFYLFGVSIARFAFTLKDVLNELNGIPNLTISVLLVIDSVGQLAYWISKKQSLPQFEHPTAIEIDDLRHHSHHTYLISHPIAERLDSYWKSSNDNFPFIVPSVTM